MPPVTLGLGDAPHTIAVNAQPTLDRVRPNPLGDLSPNQADRRKLVFTDAIAGAGSLDPIASRSITRRSKGTFVSSASSPNVSSVFVPNRSYKGRS